jgi:hypothetical protein
MEFHVCSKTTRLNTISRILERHKDREIYDKFKYLRTWRHEIYIEHIEKAYKLIRILFGITYMQSMKKNLIPKLVCYNKDIKSDPVHIWNSFVEFFFQDIFIPSIQTYITSSSRCSPFSQNQNEK